jgi:deoxyribodipyrimidine photo-lyase
MKGFSVPAVRRSVLNDRDPDPAGSFVVYWMTSSRRPHWNFALQHARDWARQLGKPLVVLEALRSDYRWASDRMHRFVVQGMVDHAKEFARRGITYYAYVEPEPGAGRGLLAAIAADACLVVGDEYPAFFLPRMVESARKIPIRLETVDSNGLLPLRAADRVFPTAYAFRRFLQRELPRHLAQRPERDPLATAPPEAANLAPNVLQRWPGLASEPSPDGLDDLIARLPIDHHVPPVSYEGGCAAGAAGLRAFVAGKLEHYAEKRNDPTEPATSRLSPYLHFGHVGAHQVFEAVARAEDWEPDRLADSAGGKRRGWWGMSESAEAFLDELVTWRELGFNRCARTGDYDRFESLPDWARETLSDHADDERPYLYSREELEAAETHDQIWNAAQRELRVEGRIHGYLRMLWGKKILEWSKTPREALQVMIELNNRWAVDGRDPNSYSGIFWVLGRYDRPWGPERPVFGKIRYMTSENTARKYRLQTYLERYGDDAKHL